ncbi:peptide deformylase [Methylococcus sp. EFPC2]|uniref:peptide deformylase n=1 Tax=Methylococcus sp. EFPC2 TaxID=2812648 RepID=UPI0019689225|nr:peptide deformylase [Methylococcus sp. EFPC2]QSA97929.1 peptide deformylase [Methylococcus sp. EFPC2]
MTTLNIVQVGDPVLRLSARALTPAEILGPEIRRLIESMRETLRAAPGVGLAAPQIGRSLRLAVIEDRAEYHRGLPAEEMTAKGRVPVPFHVIVNPEIIAYSPDGANFFEGCLSLNGYLAEVRRAQSVRVRCLDEQGIEKTIAASGWYARILQHEIDHLNGGLYIDRMDSRTFSSRQNYELFRDPTPVTSRQEPLA